MLRRIITAFGRFALSVLSKMYWAFLTHEQRSIINNASRDSGAPERDEFVSQMLRVKIRRAKLAVKNLSLRAQEMVGVGRPATIDAQAGDFLYTTHLAACHCSQCEKTQAKWRVVSAMNDIGARKTVEADYWAKLTVSHPTPDELLSRERARLSTVTRPELPLRL